MKKIIQISVIAFAGMIISQSLIAQDRKERILLRDNLRLGIKGSLNISSFNQAKDVNMDNARIGFNLGLFAKVPVFKSVTIQPELYIATKGATVSYDNAVVTGVVQYNFNYIELPVFVVVNITPNLNVHAGPYGGILLSGNVNNESNLSAFDFENNINKDNYNRIETGLAVGGGVDIGAMSVGVRYYQGLTKVGKERTYTGFNYTFPNAYNSVFNAYLNFAIN